MILEQTVTISLGQFAPFLQTVKAADEMKIFTNSQFKDGSTHTHQRSCFSSANKFFNVTLNRFFERARAKKEN